MKRCVPLESAAKEVCEQSSIPPLIFQLPPEKGRKILEEAQDGPVYQYPSKVLVYKADTGAFGTIPVYIVTPEDDDIKNTILYIHGGGWVFGSFHTHEKLVREIAARTNSCVIFPEYTRSPEARYPVAIEQCYYILDNYIRINGIKEVAGGSRLIVAGDSVGGNMAIAMCFMSRMRHGPLIEKLLLYYPVTDACFDTPSYRQFAVNYYLYRAGMQWFWNQYTTCIKDRNRITASPLRADIAWLQSLPATMLINGQADVLYSEGAAFGEKLQRAGVDVTAVQIKGTIHDFVMLNSLNETNACRTAMDISTAWINRQV